MVPNRALLQPTLRQLLSTESLSEAHLLTDDSEHDLDREISQVLSHLNPGAKAGSLILAPLESLPSVEAAAYKDFAGVVVLSHGSQEGPIRKAAKGSVFVEAGIDALIRVCAQVRTPVLSLPVLGESHELVEEVRSAFLTELKKSSVRLHAYFIQLVLEEGLEAFVKALAATLGRPVAVETHDFKLLAAENMGPTPLNQQKTVTEDLAEELNRELRAQSEIGLFSWPVEPLRIGRRLLSPVILDDVVVAYLSCILRASDQPDQIAGIMGPAALAVLVEINNRRNDGTSFSAAKVALLKDLLTGQYLSAGDQERLDQAYGFDMHDRFHLIAARLIPEKASAQLALDERIASVEIEGTRVFVLSFDSKEPRTWQDDAKRVREMIKSSVPDAVVQIGVGRAVETPIDLPESYREARQTLITGSMIHGEGDFDLCYSDLGIKRLLYLMIDHPELDRFLEEHLAPLEAYDLEWESDLLPTLRVYLEQGANLNSAAKELFVHRHTMRYRLEQIADILKVDIDSTEVLLNLQIAFLIRDLKGKSGQ